MTNDKEEVQKNYIEYEYKPASKGVCLYIRRYYRNGNHVNTTRDLYPCLADYAKSLLKMIALEKNKSIPLPYSYGAELYPINVDYENNGNLCPPAAWYRALAHCMGVDFVKEIEVIDFWKWDKVKAEALAKKYFVNPNAPKKSAKPIELDAREIEQDG